MSNVKDIFPSKFKVVINSGEGYKYTFGKTRGFNVKTMDGEKVIAETSEPLNFKKSEYLQRDYGGVHEVKSCGDLASVEVNVAHYDDFAGTDYFETEGFALVDKDLNVAYRSNAEDYTRAKLIANPTAMLKLVYNYGPCALAHAHPTVMKDENFKNLVGKTLDKRALKLRETNPEQLKEEIEQAKAVLKEFDKENQKQAETGFYSLSL